jgi:hypothetical protein
LADKRVVAEGNIQEVLRSTHPFVEAFFKNEYTKEVDYFRIKQGLKPVSVDKTQCILGISETFYQSQPDLDQLQNRG